MIQTHESVRSVGRLASHSWILLVALGILGLLFSSVPASGQPPEAETFQKITGMSVDQFQSEFPGLATYLSITLQSEAQFQISFLTLMVVIAVVPYRKLEKWSWYALWVFPLSSSVLALRVFVAGGMGWTIILAFIAIALLGLLLPYRLFFPKSRSPRIA